jgi:hypothetical protein
MTALARSVDTGEPQRRRTDPGLCVQHEGSRTARRPVDEGGDGREFELSVDRAPSATSAPCATARASGRARRPACCTPACSARRLWIAWVSRVATDGRRV